MNLKHDEQVRRAIAIVLAVTALRLPRHHPAMPLLIGLHRRGQQKSAPVSGANRSKIKVQETLRLESNDHYTWIVTATGDYLNAA